MCYNIFFLNYLKWPVFDDNDAENSKKDYKTKLYRNGMVFEVNDKNSIVPTEFTIKAYQGGT